MVVVVYVLLYAPVGSTADSASSLRVHYDFHGSFTVMVKRRTVKILVHWRWKRLGGAVNGPRNERSRRRVRSWAQRTVRGRWARVRDSFRGSSDRHGGNWTSYRFDGDGLGVNKLVGLDVRPLRLDLVALQ